MIDLDALEAKARAADPWDAKSYREFYSECGPIVALALIARIRELEAALTSWKRVSVIAAIPLEAMLLSGTDQLLCPDLRQGVEGAIAVIRKALTDNSEAARVSKETADGTPAQPVRAKA